MSEFDFYHPQQTGPKTTMNKRYLERTEDGYWVFAAGETDYPCNDRLFPMIGTNYLGISYESLYNKKFYLLPEPTNPKDPNAIAVYDNSTPKRKVGYVPYALTRHVHVGGVFVVKVDTGVENPKKPYLIQIS